MGTKIANAALMLKMLRDAGYKNTSYAVAEIVDNSIEANAKNIGIYLFEENIVRTRTVKLITEIAIFDDGDGMSEDVLAQCLSFGWGTRLEGATGLGKFGFGLKGASISQAKRVEIYSWITPENVHKTYLDYEEIRKSDTDELPDLEKIEIPTKYRKLIAEGNASLPKSGTLVIWKDLDRLNPKKSSTLIDHLNKDMCRIFRHFLDDNELYGTHRNINVKVVNPNGSVELDEKLKANDPIYLHKPNNLPGYETVATNEFIEDKTIKVIDSYGVERTVHILSSIAKPEIQALGGNSDVGRHYAHNNGISFLRAGRELELQIKGFFANSEPRHRWHGIEVRFDPQLDDYFGVPNNKQGVRNFKNYDETELEDLYADADDKFSPEKHSAKMKIELHKTITRMIKNNEVIVKSRGASKKSVGGNASTSTATKVSKKLGEVEPRAVTKSGKIAQTKTQDQKIAELIEIKQTTDTSLTYKEAHELAEAELENLIQIEESEWPGSTFLDVTFKGNAAVASVNRNHPFFSEFYDVLRRSDDQKGFEALKIFLMSFARAEDLLQLRLGAQEFEEIRDKWGEYMKQLANLSS